MSTPTATACSCSEEISRLQLAVTDMSALSKEGFADIAALARLTRRALHVPAMGLRDQQDIQQVLQIISRRAEASQECIDLEVENLS